MKKEFIDNLMSKMTVAEKVGQLNQCGNSIYDESYKIGWDVLRRGGIGSFLGITDVEKANELQKVAVEETRLGIPLLLGYDVIHGFKTVFPTPWSEACSWEPELAKRTATVSTKEAAYNGVNLIFAPMVDISRDSRWGRIVEGAGEDTYLGSKFAEARVQGIQGDDLADGEHCAACTKHFIGYGAGIGGRDYNSVDMSEQMLFNTYIPPFEAAIKAGTRSIMTAFHDLNGEPCTGSEYLLKDILRDALGFEGFTLSDAGSCSQMLVHGFTENDKDTAKTAINAGLDMEMCYGTFTYSENLEALIEEGLVSMETLDASVRRVLEVKYDLGLFENPYKNIETARNVLLTKEAKELALEAAHKSIVLLKNNGILPLGDEKIVLAGKLADNNEEMLGCWSGQGVAEDCVSPFDAFGVPMADEDFGNGDVVVAFVGETRDINGEAKSRARDVLPEEDLELLRKIKKAGKKLVTVVSSGRPLVLKEASELSDAVVFSGALGTEAGNAYKDVLFGKVNPSAKLVSSFPESVGQQPLYYNKNNTGRPSGDDERWATRYIDSRITPPYYPFGFGLSYTKYEYSNLRISNVNPTKDEVLKVLIDIENTGKFDGEEIVQLYVRDLVASNVRPIKELKGFKKVFIKAGEKVTVEIELDVSSLGFYNRKREYVVEAGEFEIMVGTSSEKFLKENIIVK